MCEKLSAVFGLLGSSFLAIPAVKHVWAQWRYERYRKIPSHRKETNEMDAMIKEQMERRAQRAYFWDTFDAVSVLVGSLCLAVSFLITVIM